MDFRTKIRELMKILLENIHERRKLILALSCVVVFATTYVLILPAFTLDKEEAAEQGGIDLPAVEQTVDFDTASEEVPAEEPIAEEAKAEESKSGEPKAEDPKEKEKASKADSRVTLRNDENGDFSIAVEGKNAGLSEDMSIKVREIDQSSKRLKKEYDSLYSDALDAVQKEEGMDKPSEFAFAKFYDISLMDGKKEAEPDSAVDVKISFGRDLQKELKVADTDRVYIVHFAVDKDTGEVTPEVLDTESTDITVKDNKVTEAEFTTDSFSIFAVVYTVDFHYNIDGKEYDFSMDGGGCVSLRSLVETLKVDDSAEAFVANVEKVQFSDPELVWVGKADNDTTIAELKEANGLKPEYSADLTKERITKSDAQMVKAGDWVLISMKPFETEESLTVTMTNGEEFVVKVTDSQISGNVLTADGKTYKITVTYDDDAEIPDGTELVAKEIKPGSKEYIQHFCKAWSEVNKEYLEQEALMNSLPDVIDDYKDIKPVILDDARFFSITLVCKNTIIEPKAPVQVDIKYADGLKPISDEFVTGVAHFKDNREVELIEDVDTITDEEGTIVDFSYIQDSFSNVGTFVGQETSDRSPLSYIPSIKLPGLKKQSSDTSLGEPDASKTLEPNVDDNGNRDGTYTLSLSVTGKAIESDSLTKANVLFIMDRSSSMTEKVYEKYEGAPQAGEYFGQNNLGNFVPLNYWQGNYYKQGESSPYTGVVYTKTTTTRLASEQAAMRVLINSLLEKNEANPDTVMMSVISFADTRGDKEKKTKDNKTWRTDVTETAWTANSETLIGAVDATEYMSGTNWEEALKYAQEKVNQIPDDRKDEKTYVIFLTDGEPTAIHGETGGAKHYENDNGIYNGGFEAAYGPARDDARDIVEAGYEFYTVMTFNPLVSANKFLKRLTNYAYDYDGDGVGGDSIDNGDDVDTNGSILSDYYFNASTPSELTSAFENIFSTISKSIAHGQVKIKDGLTAGAMTTTFVAGSPSGVRYVVTKNDDDQNEVELYSVTAKNNPADTDNPIVTFHINGEDYSTTDTGDRQVKKITNPEGFDAGTYYTVTVDGTEYKMALANIDASGANTTTSGMLIWDLSPVGTLWGDCTYRAEFIVWPNQAAYDYVAALNNKDSGYAVADSSDVDWDESVETDEHLIEDSEHNHYWTGGVNDYPSIVKYKDGPYAGKYAVLTNTSQTLDYSVVTQEGNKEPVVVPQLQVPLDPPDPMPLEKTEAKIEKIWNIENNKKVLYDLLYGDVDEETGEIIPFEILFDIKQGNSDYTTVSLPGCDWDESAQDYDWTNDKYYNPDYMESYSEGGSTRSFSTHWIKDFSISTGLMLSRAEMLEINLDPDAYVDKRVYDKNGDDYYLLEDGHDFAIKERENYEISYEFDFSEPSYHPMLVDGVLMDVTFKVVDGVRTISKMEPIPVVNGVSTLTAENTLRGYIHLDKDVVDKNGNHIDDDTEFRYTITLENQNGLFEGTHIPWYAINNCFYRTEDGDDIHYYQVDKIAGSNWRLKTEDGKTYDFTDLSFDKDIATAQTITYYDPEAGDDVQLTLLGNQMEADDTFLATKTMSITQDQTLSIGNVPEGTRYTIKELYEEGYALIGIENPDGVNPQYSKYEIESDLESGEITGIIIPNHDNGITYTNKRVEADLKIYKVTKDSLDREIKEYLEGAEFTITQLDENGSGNYKLNAETGKLAFEKKVTTDENGMASVSKIQEGYYEIRETDTPDGYILSSEPDYFKVENGVLIRLSKITDDDNTTEKNETLVVNWPENADNTGLFRFEAAQAPSAAVYTVGNEPGAALPHTGGIGTTIFYIFGVILTLGSAVILISRMRIQNNSKKS